MTFYDRVASQQNGERALARARLQRAILRSLDRAFRLSMLSSQSALARRLHVRRSAVSQVFRGDGNVRISTLADYMWEMGFEVNVELVPAGEMRRAAVSGRRPVPVAQTSNSSAITALQTFVADQVIHFYGYGYQALPGFSYIMPSSAFNVTWLPEHASTISAASDFAALPFRTDYEIFAEYTAHTDRVDNISGASIVRKSAEEVA